VKELSAPIKKENYLMSTLIHVRTKLGKIAVEIEERDGAMPVIFLHGVSLDRHLEQGGQQ
jgi:hypothetical protein